MAKKKRGRKMPAWKKWARAGMGIFGTAIGALVATSPTHRGIQLLAAGQFESGIAAIQHDFGLPTATLAPNPARIVGAVITVAGGLGLIALFRAIARRI